MLSLSCRKLLVLFHVQDEATTVATMTPTETTAITLENPTKIEPGKARGYWCIGVSCPDEIYLSVLHMHDRII